MLEYKWTLKTWGSVKETGHKGCVHTVWFRLYVMSVMGKSIRTESRLVIAWGWGHVREVGGACSWIQHFFWEWWVCSKIVMVLTQLSEYTQSVSSVAQSCLTLCHPMNCSMPGLPVHHKLLEFTHTHAHQVGDAIQPSHPLSSPSLPAPNPSQHQGLFQWVNSSHEVAKVLEFQLQHQSFQWTFRIDRL